MLAAFREMLLDAGNKRARAPAAKLGFAYGPTEGVSNQGTLIKVSNMISKVELEGAAGEVKEAALLLLKTLQYILVLVSR